jgi:CBS domain-containing protein
MEREKSLDLDTETTGRGEKSQSVVRIAVVGPQGCTRDGSAATITADCATPAALEREIERLREELEDALQRGRSALGGASARRARPRPAPAASSRKQPRASAPERPKLAIDWTVADVMTREVRTVGKNDPLSAAKALMDEGRFRHLVVVDAENAVEGVLSHRDLFFGPLAWSLGQGLAAYEKLLDASRVKDVMHEDVVTIEGSATLQVAAARMLERKIGCLPVTDGVQLVGLLTEGDFLQRVAGANR